MAIVDLDFIKMHLRIDHAFEDAYLSILLDACIEEVTALTGVNNDDQAPQRYRIAVAMLVSHRYSLRELTTDKTVNPVPFGFANLVTNISTGGEI